MDQELKTKLIQYLETLEAKAADGMDFVASEAPLVAQEWLAFRFWSSFVAVIAGIFLLSLAGIALRITQQEMKKDDLEIRPEVLVPAGVMTLTGVVCGVSLIADNTYDLIKITTAPRIVILEKIQELTR